MQATLDFEFLHQNMVAHVTPTSAALLADVYAVISKVYSRSNNEPAEELNRELEAVKRTLYDARKATSVNFLCLRDAKPRTSASSGASDAAADKASAARTGAPLGRASISTVASHNSAKSGALAKDRERKPTAPRV